MAIIPKTATTIKCDGVDLMNPCRHQAVINQVAPISLASKAARTFGWSLEVGHDRCPECRRISEEIALNHTVLLAA